MLYAQSISLQRRGYVHRRYCVRYSKWPPRVRASSCCHRVALAHGASNPRSTRRLGVKSRPLTAKEYSHGNKASCQRHQLSATAHAVVEKSKKSSQFVSYTAEGGIEVVAGVIVDGDVCKVTVSCPVTEGMSVSQAVICWGLFRREKEAWFRPDGSRIEKGDGPMRTDMTKSASTYKAVIDIPQKCCPTYFGCNIELNGGEQTLHPEESSFVRLPLGMSKGQPSQKGVSQVSSPKGKGETVAVNFAVVSRHADSMTLCLLPGSDDVIELDLLPEYNKSGDVWHIAIETTQRLDTVLYGWKADGEYGWEGGSRFHPDTTLLDPYSKCILPTTSASKEVFLGSLAELSADPFNWEQVPRPRQGYEHLVVSELDLTSLSPSDSVLNEAVELTTKMAESGVNGVVLRGAVLSLPDAVSGLAAPLSFFAPNCKVFSSDSPQQSSNELKTLIKHCHKQSMEVLLEVQFCFTSEDKARMSLKGLDVSLYFRGKGILNCGHPVVQELILDSLHHWMYHYKVDGFVFCNAETMVQDRDGMILDSPALPQAIAADPLLKMCKLVAVSGDDQLIPRQGERGFPHWGVWTEYNTRFRFDFWDFIVMTTNAKLSNIATRITGSADLFAACWDGGFPGSLAAGRRPSFGFNSPVAFFNELSKSVAADAPHKRILGDEESASENVPMLCSLLMASILSQGVPVIPRDCWSKEALPPFISTLLEFRTRYSDLIQPSAFDAIRGIEWHGALAGHQPDWEGGMHSHFIGYSIREGADRALYVGFNAYGTEMEVQAPDAGQGKIWKCVAYSALPNTDKEILVSSFSMFHMAPKAAVVLELIADPNAKTAFTPEI